MNNFSEGVLSHYGVKGMRWGVRKDRPGGISRAVDRKAKGDAKEFVRAKAYFGEGAGTRRKLIKQTIEGRTKRYGEGYKKAVDKYVDEQDTAKAVDKAVSKRRRTDAAQATKKTAKAGARRITGEAGNAGALVALGVAGYAYSQSPQGQARMNRAVNSVQNSSNLRQGQQMVTNLINRAHGIRNVQDLINS